MAESVQIGFASEDDYFGAPFIDIDEWRERPHRHRYVHGGFGETDTRFSIYLPPAERYEDRFFSSLEGGVGGHETRAAYLKGDGLATIGFAFANGAYLVESNNGHIAVGPATSRGKQHGSITTFRATAQTARFARRLAETMYGRRPARGYIFGPSGGGWRTILCMENTRGIWDGAAPYISPAGNGISFPCAVGNLARVLGEDVGRVVDAWEPGGSGDPFAGLGARQREELGTLYRAGLQPGAEFQLLEPAIELAVLLLTSQMNADFDPEYFSDFWTVAGYAGAGGALDSELIDRVVRVLDVLSARDLLAADPALVDAVAPEARDIDPSTPVAIRIDRGAGGARGSDVWGGDDRGARPRHKCIGVMGEDVLVFDFRRLPVADIAVGDKLRVDNRDYLAYCHAYRHQIDADSLDCRHLTVAGTPIFPQRRLGVPDLLAGMPTTARFEGKMIYTSNLKDTLASPIGGTITYMGRVRAQFGAEAPQRIRVWLNDNAGHITPLRRRARTPPVAQTRIVDYDGSIEHAVRALIRWVEEGVEPPPDTSYHYEDGRITLPSSAPARGGVQPVVSATVNGAEAATVRTGEPVRLAVTAHAPPGAGRIVCAEWDFDGTAAWPHQHEVDGTQSRIDLETEHIYERPGVYFACARVASHQDGDTAARHGRILNLARVRVEVTS
jgi:hypothetical protein